MICSKCHETLERLTLLALLMEFGTRVTPRPDKCRNGGEHSFVKEVARV